MLRRDVRDENKKVSKGAELHKEENSKFVDTRIRTFVVVPKWFGERPEMRHSAGTDCQRSEYYCDKEEQPPNGESTLVTGSVSTIPVAVKAINHKGRTSGSSFASIEIRYTLTALRDKMTHSIRARLRAVTLARNRYHRRVVTRLMVGSSTPTAIAGWGAAPPISSLHCKPMGVGSGC